MTRLFRISLALIFSIALFSCSDNGCKPVKPETEEPQMITFAAANGLTMTKHSSGMYYQVVNAGVGISPTPSNKVVVTYVGKKLDGNVFDQSSAPVAFNLSQLIEGWQVGLQLIKKGGQIRLLVPSSMAYGCTGSGQVIPSNAVLYFDISLIDVQ